MSFRERFLSNPESKRTLLGAILQIVILFFGCDQFYFMIKYPEFTERSEIIRLLLLIFISFAFLVYYLLVFFNVLKKSSKLEYALGGIQIFSLVLFLFGWNIYTFFSNTWVLGLTLFVIVHSLILLCNFIGKNVNIMNRINSISFSKLFAIKIVVYILLLIAICTIVICKKLFFLQKSEYLLDFLLIITILAGVVYYIITLKNPSKEKRILTYLFPIVLFMFSVFSIPQPVYTLFRVPIDYYAVILLGLYNVWSMIEYTARKYNNFEIVVKYIQNNIPSEVENNIVTAPNQSLTVNYTVTEGYISVVSHILLLLFTFGIWKLVWIYKTTKLLNKFGCKYRSPAGKLLMNMFIPFYSIYWNYKTAKYVDCVSKSKNITSEIAPSCLLASFFMVNVVQVIIQLRINDICSERIGNEFVIIQEYKGLLDQGVITQEEFDSKKRQIFGL